MTADWSTIVQGLRVAAAATVVSAAIGLWLAAGLTGRRVLAALAPALGIIPAPVICYDVLALVGFWSFSLVGLTAAAILSASQIFMPHARSAFDALDPAYGNAARSLGASEWRAFSRVQLPLAFRGIAVGSVSAFVSVIVQLAFGYWIVGRLTT